MYIVRYYSKRQAQAALGLPDPEARSARVWLQAYVEFCIYNEVLAAAVQSDYRTPIIANYEYQTIHRTRSVREAAKSAARELGYPDLKPEQLKVVETFEKRRDIYNHVRQYGYSLSHGCLTIVFDTLLGTGGEDGIVVVVQAPVMY